MFNTQTIKGQFIYYKIIIALKQWQQVATTLTFELPIRCWKQMLGVWILLPSLYRG
jgi:hypothetical protein